MHRATSATNAFLATLRERYERARAVEPEYDAIVYRARFLPDPEVLHLIVRMCARRGGDAPPVPEQAAVRTRLADDLRPMQWPDPRPLHQASTHLTGWDTLHITTLLHALIPDYAVWGPEETSALGAIGLPTASYVATPTEAVEGYGSYLRAIKGLREAAHHDEVPESHHFLTRIVQAALLDLARERARD